LIPFICFICFSTHSPSKPQKPQNNPISTGNGGVPTDRQTDRQTDKRDEIPLKRDSFRKTDDDPIEKASEILESLDNIKKELRLKFKRLTDQELFVFSTIYQLEEESIKVDYKILSEKLKLSESSIRDYVGRLIKKEIPVDKIKINNKNIRLSISKNLKKIASLNTIMQLRDI